jgi:hypothetical protein
MLALLSIACADKNPVASPQPDSLSLPLHGILFTHFDLVDLSSGIDWIAPDGSDRRSVVKGSWQITSAPRALKIPIRKAGYLFGDPSEMDSLFVLGMADGARTFIASYPSSSGNGLILSPAGRPPGPGSFVPVANPRRAST